MDFEFKQGELPANVNIYELYEQLPDEVSVSTARDNEGNLISITVHAPDNTNYDDIKEIVKNHVPTKTEQQEVEQEIADDYERRLQASKTIQNILSRIYKLEGL